jgi:hypothetical protein
MSHLSIGHSFNQGFGDLLEETIRTEQVFGLLVVFQKFVEDFFCDGIIDPFSGVSPSCTNGDQKASTCDK